MSTTLERMADDVFGAVRDYVARNLAPIVRRLDELAAREPPAPVKGLDGKDADEAAIESRVLAKVLKALDDIPPPKDGRDADEAAIEARLLARVTEVVKALPPPKDGKDADPALVAAEAAERVLRIIRQPADGKSVTLAEAMEHLEPLIEGEISKWELEFERRAGARLDRSLERVQLTKAGKDGRGIAEVVPLDGGRVMRFKFTDGSLQDVITAMQIYRGTHVKGTRYEVGDAVTYGGSEFVAMQPTDSDPGSNGDWRLAVKRGRDAKP